MAYLDGIRILREIEQSYPVMSITFKGQPIWPFVRIYMFQLLGATNHQNAHKVESSKIRTVVKALFAYNPFTVFKRHKNWLFTATERRKVIGDKYIQRVSGFMSEIDKNCLVIEKPSTHLPHISKKHIAEKYIISEGYLLLSSHIIERFLRYKKLKIENEHILLKIIKDYSLSFDYNYFVRYLWSQKIATDLLLRCFPMPERVLIECPYNILGYVWSFHCRNIKVIELQHGVIGNSHYAYILPHKSIFSPDEIWVYGNRDVKFLKEFNPQYASNIFDTGLYYLDYAYRAFNEDIFAQFRDQYNHIIVFAGQAAVEEAVHTFIDEAAADNPETLFIYVPRFVDEVFDIKRTNVMFAPGVNIYQYLKWCDLHITVSSTTCLEVAYYGKKTIFYNFNNLASSYYSDTLKEGQGVRYINSPHQLRSAIDSLTTSNENINNDGFSKFSLDYVNNLLNR